ncbi:helix-loop-helix DNA-binding domain-containing transcription factor, partial [Mucor lusitanicus CBS 277.49]
EIKRQIHIQSEQKRRAQIKDGFEDLRNELPSCLNKKMSKVALLHRTVQHIQHLKNTQMTILAELERLVGEND